METLDAIRARRTHSKLIGPGPNAADISLLLQAAEAAPDHGKLRPWRFVVYTGDNREVLGNAFADFALRNGDDADDVAKARAKASRAPTVIACVAVEQESKNIPFVEQIMAVSAAVQNMLLAATDLGFGSKWSTGKASRDAGVKKTLGFEETNEIVAFVYLGSVVSESEVPRLVRPVE